MSGGAAPIPEGLDEALCDLAAAMDLVEEGYDRLPPFVRKLAAGVLRKRTGLTLPEWRAWITELGDAARGIRQAGPEERAARLQVLLAREDRDRALAGLAGCVQSIPEQARRFTRDRDFLDELTRAAAEQEKRINRVRRMLRILAAPH